MPSRSGIRTALIEIVGESAMPVPAIVEELIAAGVEHGTPAEVEDRLRKDLQLDCAFAEMSGGVMFIPAVMSGTTWTVWVDAEDAAAGYLRGHPDLSSLMWWLISDLDVVDLVDDRGECLGPIETDGFMIDGRDTDVVIGPDGWLDGLADGWSSVTVGRDSIQVRRCETPPTPDPEQVAAVRAAFDRAERSERSPGVPTGLRFAGVEGPISEAIVADPSVFRRVPIAPVTAVYAAAGFELRNALVAPVGFDWEALSAWQTRNRYGWMYDLDAEEADRLDRAVHLCHRFAVEGRDGLGADFADSHAAAVWLTAVVDDDRLAAPFWNQVSFGDMTPRVMGEYVDWLVSEHDGNSTSGLGYLQARSLAQRGKVVDAADLAIALARPDCTHDALLLDAAAFAADRGDAVTAMRCLEQAGVVSDLAERSQVSDFDPDDLSDEERLLREVAGFAQHRPPAAARRNEPCPCGSGRKYKACHLGKEQHSLDDRCTWLYDKARRFWRDLDGESVVLADEIARGDHELARTLTDMPFVVDMSLHEGGGFEEFLEERGGLLPDDEALLAQQWTFVDRGVFEVQDFGADWLVLHNIGLGETIRVVNTTPGDETRVGTLLCGRPLPVGETYRALTGFLRVPPTMARGLTDSIGSGDRYAIAEQLGALFAPPRLANTDGETTFDAAVLIDETVHDAADLVAAARQARSGSSGAGQSTAGVSLLRSTDPDKRTLAAEIIDGYEQRWVDEPVPALGGRTPRDAITDPIGREEVVQLLASFPIPAYGEIGMDPRRLQAMLGL